MPSLKKIDGYEDIYLNAHGRYYVRIYTTWSGERYITTKEKDLRRALKRAKEIRAEFFKLDPNYRPQTWGEVAIECFKVRHKDNRDRTVQEAAYIYQNRLIPAFGHLPVGDVTDALWLEQVETWKRETKRKSYAQVRVYAVQVDNYAFRKGYKKFRCDFPVSDPKKRVGLVLSDKQFAELVAATDAKHVSHKNRLRTRAFLRAARYQGMRKNEILKLRVDQVDIPARSITLGADDVKTGSRTGRGRTFGIAPECMGDILELVAQAQGGYLFPNRKGTGPITDNKEAIDYLRERSGIDFNPHDLRHTFLTVKLLVEKKPPMDVAIYAGVSLQVIQDVYLHPTVEDTRHVVDPKQESPQNSESEASDARIH